MGTRSLTKSSAATTSARAAQDGGFKNCCLRSGRYDGSRKNHFFPGIIRTQFLRAEEPGLSLEKTNPTFTNLSAGANKQIVPRVGGRWIVAAEVRKRTSNHNSRIRLVTSAATRKET